MTTATATDPEIREWPGGFSWLAFPGEAMRRASHAISQDGRVWLIDPVDFDGLDERVADAGNLVGIVVLLDRHTRDAGKIAARHDVPVMVPSWMDGIETKVDAPVKRFEDRLEGTEFESIRVLDNRFWQECALWDGETVLIPEAIGSSPFFTVGEERLGVQLVLRLVPPRQQLGGLEPVRVLTGHGMGVFEDGGGALADALAGSRRRAPRYYLGLLRSALPV